MWVTPTAHIEVKVQKISWSYPYFNILNNAFRSALNGQV